MVKVKIDNTQMSRDKIEKFILKIFPDLIISNKYIMWTIAKKVKILPFISSFKTIFTISPIHRKNWGEGPGEGLVSHNKWHDIKIEVKDTQYLDRVMQFAKDYEKEFSVSANIFYHNSLRLIKRKGNSK